MNIVVTTDTFWPRTNGVAVSVDTFKKALLELGHDVHVFAPDYPMTPEVAEKIKDRQGNVIRFKSYPLFFDMEDRMVFPWKKREVFKQIDSLKPDIIHVNTEFQLGRFAKKYAKKYNIPFIMTCHTYFEQYLKFYFPWVPHSWIRSFATWLTKLSFNGADRIICPSTYMKEVLESYGVKRPISIIPTGLDPKDFAGPTKANEKANSELYQKYPQLKGKKVLLFVGRVGQEKNVDLLIEVMKKVVPAYPDVIQLVVGDGPYRPEMQKKVADQGLADHFVFTGYIDRKILKNVYTFADVLTFPSKTETQGLVTVEAMLCHTPVVAVGIMGTREVMNGDNGGYMVDENADIFAQRVVSLLKDEKLYQQKSQEAWDYAQNWTIGTMAKKMENLYREMIENNKQGKRE